MTDETQTQTVRAGPNKGKSVAAVMGAACLLIAPITMASEGERTTAYVDHVAAHPIPTTCFGHTGPEVRPYQHYTHEQCVLLLHGDQVKHAKGVYQCTPNIAERTEVYGAMTDLAFNEGIGTYCHSSMARFVKTRQWSAACQSLSMYGGVIKRVNGRKVKVPVKGLVNRRNKEIKVCLKGAF